MRPPTPTEQAKARTMVANRKPETREHLYHEALFVLVAINSACERVRADRAAKQVRAA